MADFKELGFDSVDIAKALRWIGKEKNKQLNMTKLNKLLYIAYGVLLVKTKERLTKEHPAAWPYGPVFPRMHRHVKLSDSIEPSFYNSLSDALKNLLSNVVDVFGDIPASQLSAWSHEEGSPWSKALARGNGDWNQKLSDDDIYSYFYSFVKAEA